MAETFHLVQEKNVALVSCKLRKRPFECHPEGRMRSRCPRLGAPRLLGIVARNFLLAPPATPSVVAGVNQDPVRPRYEARLAPKAGNAPLHLQEGLLYGILGVNGIAKDIPRQVLHARAMHGVEALVSAQVSGPAPGSQCGILTLGIHSGRTGAAGKWLGRFHSRPPFARQGRDSSLPGQRKSHSSHSWLLTYRRPGRGKCHAHASGKPELPNCLFTADYCSGSVGDGKALSRRSLQIVLAADSSSPPVSDLF